MEKADRKLIYILLIIIAICSIILIIKITSTRKYNEALYSEIYKEYNEIFGNKEVEENIESNNNIESSNNNTITSTSSKKKIYMQETSDGTRYRVIASIFIPKVEVTYPVIAETTDEYLKIAPCKFWGVEPNEVGNLSIIGHNYKNSQFFSNINKVEKGDRVVLTSKTGSELTYKVFDKYEVGNKDFSCTKAETDGTIDLTLITCTNLKSKKYVVKCRANTNN